MHAMIRTNEVCNTSHLSFTSSSKTLQNTFWTKMFHTRILYMSDEKRAFCAFQNTVQFWGNHAWPDNILNVSKNALTLSGFQIVELDESCPFWYKLNIVTAFPWLWSFCHMMRWWSKTYDAHKRYKCYQSMEKLGNWL